MNRHSFHALLLMVGLSSLSATAALAQQPADGQAPGIWIADATGVLRQVQPPSQTFLRNQAPGAVRLVLSVESFAQSATGALAAGQLAATRVRHAISGFAIAGDGFAVELAYVEPRYQHRILAATWEKPRLLGFDAAYVITLQTTSSSNLGLLIDSAMGAGATRVISVDPEIYSAR